MFLHGAAAVSWACARRWRLAGVGTTGFGGPWWLRGVFARARPGGSVSGARRAARPRKPRRGGRRSTGYGLARLFCIICSAALLAQKFFKLWL